MNPSANPDYKQVFDCGCTLNDNDPIAAEKLSFYAPNLWPDNPVGFFIFSRIITFKVLTLL